MPDVERAARSSDRGYVDGNGFWGAANRPMAGNPAGRDRAAVIQLRGGPAHYRVERRGVHGVTVVRHRQGLAIGRAGRVGVTEDVSVVVITSVPVRRNSDESADVKVRGGGAAPVLKASPLGVCVAGPHPLCEEY